MLTHSANLYDEAGDRAGSPQTDLSSLFYLGCIKPMGASPVAQW